MVKKIDLHTHSTASDGTFTPSEVAYEAHKKGLSAVALTDHDTINGLNEFKQACEEFGIESISGVEISAKYEKEMHIVGLLIDETDTELAEKLDELKKAREVRNKKVLELINKQGMEITADDILSQTDGATFLNTGRAHIARAMLNKGYVASIDEAFVKYLGKGMSCYVSRKTYSPKESIEMIKKAGGLAILAHPVYITEDYDKLFNLLTELKEYGLDGMECLYNCYSESFSKICFDICDKLGLVKSGGSDFHGGNKPNVELGKVSGGYVPYEFLLNMKKQRSLKG